MGSGTPRIAVSDLPESARRLLRTILDWYNGERVDGRHIATDRPPKWSDEHAFAVGALREQGLVHAERVLGTKVEWALTPKGRRLLDGVAGVDLVGDFNESLRHRTGVAVVARWLRCHRDDTRAEETVEYPGEPGSQRLDVRSWTDHDNCSLGFEVLTDHNDVDLYRRKLEHCSNPDSPRRVALVFPSRRVANSVLNTVHCSEKTDVSIPNFPVDDPSQWSFRKVHRYIAEGLGRYGDHYTDPLPTTLRSYYSLFEGHTRTRED